MLVRHKLLQRDITMRSTKQEESCSFFVTFNEINYFLSSNALTLCLNRIINIDALQIWSHD